MEHGAEHGTVEPCGRIGGQTSDGVQRRRSLQAVRRKMLEVCKAQEQSAKLAGLWSPSAVEVAKSEGPKGDSE